MGNITRRSFVAATAASVAASAIAGSAAAEEAAKAPEFCAENWLGTEPETPAEFAEELEADVVVCGLGHAGCAATRAAAEEGCSVIAFEKSFNLGLGSKDFCAYGSKLFLERFPEIEPYWSDGRKLLMNEVSKGCLGRNDSRILKKWIDINGENCDWYLTAPGDVVSFGTSENGNTYDKEAEYQLYACNWPLPANYNPYEENMPCLPGSFKMGGTTRIFLQANLDRAADAAGDKLQIRLETRVVKLLKEDGRVTGVVAQDAEGNLIKATARNGVVLATGDFMNDGDMLAAFVPNVLSTGYVPFGEYNWYSTMDSEGKPTNTGDGHRMAVWAGGRMQEYGCTMSHLTGNASSPFGTMPFLMLDAKGSRFMNEDVQGQQYAERVRQLPGRYAYQIFDAGCFEQMADMPYGHGKNHLAGQGAVDKAVEAGTTFVADTLEELVAQLDIDTAAALASIGRYNELCAVGSDDDFGKTAKRMFAIENAPFYASIVKRGDDLVTMSGIVCDDNCRVLDESQDVIEGLYVAGNVQGGRFATIYPESALGISVAMAVCFGREAGTNAARAL